MRPSRGPADTALTIIVLFLLAAITILSVVVNSIGMAP